MANQHAAAPKGRAADSNEHWTVGAISITKIQETEGWTPLEFLLQVFPKSSREEIAAVEWLSPDYVADDMSNGGVNCMLVETPTHKIVVDPGIGNDKNRIASMFRLHTDFLERFQQVWALEDVDAVLSTHLHVDHVGWNTRLVDGCWVPTFPNARYWFVREEFEHWRRFSEDESLAGGYSEFGWTLVDAGRTFDDSLKPVEDADQITWVEPGQEVVPGVTLLSTAGHTPGHVSVLLQSGGETAVITGDLMHTQMQIAKPDWSPEMDTDPEAAARTRRAFIERFADTDVLVLGTHFGTPTGGRIVTDGGSHKLLPVVH